MAVLRKHRVWLSVHFCHARELTPEVAQAADLLADGGIPLGCQTVLLKGVNDSAPVLGDLFHGLLKLRIRPYYLYQCDPVLGTGHLRTSVAKGLELMEQLRGHTTGYAVPTYVVDAPGGGGKIPVQAETIVGHDGDVWQLRNWAGKVYSYRDPQEGNGGHGGHGGHGARRARGARGVKAAPGARSAPGGNVARSAPTASTARNVNETQAAGGAPR